MPKKKEVQNNIKVGEMLLDNPGIRIDATEGGIKFNQKTGTVDSVMILTVTTKIPFKFLPAPKDKKEGVYKEICDIDLTPLSHQQTFRRQIMKELMVQVINDNGKIIWAHGIKDGHRQGISNRSYSTDTYDRIISSLVLAISQANGEKDIASGILKSATSFNGDRMSNASTPASKVKNNIPIA